MFSVCGRGSVDGCVSVLGCGSVHGCGYQLAGLVLIFLGLSGTLLRASGFPEPQKWNTCSFSVPMLFTLWNPMPTV